MVVVSLYIWLIELKNITFAVYDLLLTRNFIKDLYIHLLLGKFSVHVMQQRTCDD